MSLVMQNLTWLELFWSKKARSRKSLGLFHISD